MKFNASLFYSEDNRFVGSGGELIVKDPSKSGGGPTRIDPGDTLIGIGATHYVESLAKPPGPSSFRAYNATPLNERKMALRAFRVTSKRASSHGFDFGFSPLSPQEYSDTVSLVSSGAVHLSPATIPQGTIIISFLEASTAYTLEKVAGSPAENWRLATQGSRHWNVGIGKPDDYWEASFPTDDVAFLSQVPSSTTVGRIQFGLSLLPGSPGGIRLKPVASSRQLGQTSMHDFVLSGAGAGIMGLNTAFPIGLRTAITFHPLP